MDTFCWVTGTYSAENWGNEIPPGIGRYTIGARVHDWYQWVWLVLAFQAYLYRLPHYLWKNWEGTTSNDLLKNGCISS